MSNVVDVGEVQRQVKEYFKFDKLLMIGIHEDDGSYIAVVDEELTDIQLVYMSQAIEDARQKRNK